MQDMYLTTWEITTQALEEGITDIHKFVNPYTGAINSYIIKVVQDCK